MSVAQLTYNSATTETISVSSFFANYDFELETQKKSRQFAQIAQKAMIQVEQLSLLQQELQKNIIFLSKRSALYANKKRDRRFTLKEGDKAYLLRRHIKTKRSSNKLNYTKLESYRVLRFKGSVNYELELLKSMRIHSVFHISILELADSETLLQINPSDIDSESQVEKYEVEEILDQQNVQGQLKYLIK